MADADIQQLEGAVAALAALGSGRELTLRLGAMERRLQGIERDAAVSLVEAHGISGSVLEAALLVKAFAGQINVVVHAVGILLSLPYVLEGGETIESLSLGAGNTGRAYDLETDRQIAEFKFIEWRGGSESIRQNSLFVDLFNLASADTSKKRVLYVVGKAAPMRFLQNRRSVASVLSKNGPIAARFARLHGNDFQTVRDYYENVRGEVEIVDLRDKVPLLQQLSTSMVVT